MNEDTSNPAAFSKADYGLLLLGLLAVVSYVVFTVANGGDALTGKAEGNKFFIGERLHYREVPRHIYGISAALTIFAAAGIFMIGNRVLHALELLNFFSGKPALKKILNVFFGLGTGYIALSASAAALLALSK